MRHRIALVQDAERSSDAYHCYLDSVGFCSELPIGIVDLGFSATQQKYLFGLTRQQMVGYYFLATKTAMSLDGENCRVIACFNEDFDLRAGPLLYRHSLLLEAMLAAPHGQLCRFEIDEDGLVQPILNSDVLPESKWQNIEKISSGVIEYLDLLAKGNPGCLKKISFNDEALEEALVDLARGDVPFDCSGLSLTVEDAFCGNGRIDALAHSRFVMGYPANRPCASSVSTGV